MNMKPLTAVTWSPAFSVGIKLIDDQHKGLLNLVNDMYMHLTGNKNEERTYFTKVIQQMALYIKNDLGTEEKLMIMAGFSGYMEHKRVHDAFAFTVEETIRNFEAGKRFVLLEFTRFLREWVFTHIAIMDKQHFTCIKKLSRGKSKSTYLAAER